MRQEGVVCDLDFRKLTPASIEAGSKDLMARLRTEYDKVGQLGPDQVNFESCIQVRL